jgi:hypothetical protein
MLASCRKSGYRSFEYQARLALLEIELRTHPASARLHFIALENDAKAHNLLLVANHAHALASGK